MIRRFPPHPSQNKSQLRASESYSPAPSTHGGSSSARPSDIAVAKSQTQEPSVANEPAPVLVFRADPRMTTCFDGLPEGADAVKAKFGVA